MISGPAAKQKAGSALEWIGEWVEARAGVLMGALLCLFFVALVGLAATVYLWYDELVTMRVAGLPHWHDVWNFYASGLDTIGLLYALVLHVVLKLPVDTEISSRLPAMVMFLGMLLCVFVFVRRRYAAVYAFAVVLLLMTFPFLENAVFAKSYAFELAGVAFAMICWQTGMAGRYRLWSALGVWCGLALAIYSHTFAIFLFVPFAAAQGLGDARRKRVDWPMWAALVLYPAALLPVLRGDLLASKLYGSNFWSKPSSALMKQTYIDYFVENWRYVLILVAASWIVWAVLGDRKVVERGPQAERTGFSAPEWLFVALLTALPAYVLPASYLLHAYRDIYVLSYAIGMGILLVCIMAEQWRRSAAGGTVVLILFASVTLRVDLKTIPGGLRVMAHPHQVHSRLQAEFDREPWVKLLEESDLPVLMGDHVFYTRTDAYVPADLRRRMYFLTNFAQVDQYPKTETSQRNFLLFGKMLGYQTMDIGDFVPEHRHFLMAIHWSPVTLHGTLWLEPYMLKQEALGNATLQFLGPDTEVPNVFDVKFTRLPEFPVAKPLKP
jgi:Dolichyl-phosphate-mannose-protein mannosyltransferase